MNFSVRFFKDIPRSFVFVYKNKTFLRGPYIETIENFARYFHFDLHIQGSGEIPDAVQVYTDIFKRKYDMSTYSTTYGTSPELISYSYPLERNQKCVMVPFAAELPRFLYIFWPFESYIWVCLIAGIFYIGILMRFMAMASTKQQVARSIIRNIPYALSITLFSSNMGQNVKQAPLRVIFFYTLLYLYGFVISAYHMPYLTSFCMKPLFVKPIDTLEDILAAKLTIIIKHTSFEELEQGSDTKWPILRPQMVRVTGRIYQGMLQNFNSSHAYVVSLDQWNFLNKQQMHLKRPFFHLSRVCFSTALRSYPVQHNWPLIDKLNYFILHMFASGFWNYWIETAFVDAVFIGDADILLDTHPVEGLTFDFFIIAWIIVAIGSVISFLVWIMEIFVWSYHERKRRERRRIRKILRRGEFLGYLP